MKKFLSVMLAMALALSMAAGFGFSVSAEPGVQTGDSLKVVNPAGGPYVIATNIQNGSLQFNYGWNNVDKFEFVPLGYYVGVYDLTESHYVWDEELVFSEQAPKLMKLKQSTELISGNDYLINFFVRDYYDDPDDINDQTTNGAIVQVYFTAP